MTASGLAVRVLAGDDEPRARALARQLGLDFGDVEPAADGARGADRAAPSACLLPTHAGLALRVSTGRSTGDLCLDFTSDEHRRRARTAHGSALVRALGVGRGVRTIVDATAGLARDAFVLAAAGADVTLIEREPVVAALLADALERARTADAATAAIVARMTLHVGDAAHLLRTLPPADAVYLDPMFEDRGKTALAKKELQVLRALLGSGSADASLLECARAKVLRRVAVKRHPSAPALLPRPAAVIRGQRARFDVYTPQR